MMKEESCQVCGKNSSQVNLLAFIMFADRLYQVTPSLHCCPHIHHQQQGRFRQNGLWKSSPPGDFHTDFQETIPSGFPHMDDGNLPQQIPMKPKFSSGFPHMDDGNLPQQILKTISSGFPHMDGSDCDVHRKL
jgi:hypothetical protein